MSKQLVVKDILDLVNNLLAKGMPAKEIMETPIYIGDDDELNGIHTAWYVNTVDPNNEEDADLVELIKERGYSNVPIKGKSILIS